LYQRSAVANNYFAGDLGIGGEPTGTEQLRIYRNDTATTPQLTIEQDSTGDASMNFLLSATAGWSMGIDNSDSDMFKISASNTLASSTVWWIKGGGDSGIGIEPEVRFHVADGDISKAWAPIQGTAMIVESTDGSRAFFTLAGANQSEIFFADVASQTAGRVRYDHTTDQMQLYTGGGQRTILNSTGFGVGGAPDAQFHAYRNDTAVTPQLILEQDSTGDASMQFRLTATSNSVIGIDNSDGDYLKLAGHADSFAAANTYLRMNTVQIGAILNTAAQFHIFRNDTSSTALFRLSNAGTGDTYIRWDNGAEEFSTGMDYSDGNTFKIQPGSGPLGTTLQGLMISQEGRHAIGNTQNAGSWLYVAGGLETTANATRTTIKAELPRRNVDANETNYYFGFHSEWQAQTFDIANLITDSGSREGFRCEAFVNEAAFLGTLAAQRGAYIRTGHAGSSGAGTITNSIGVFIENLASGAATVTNEWGIYQSSTTAENCFQGNTGFGTVNIGAEVHAYANRAATTNQIRAENDGSGDAMMMFNLTATKQFSIGIDNSDQDSFKINRGTSLGANEDFRIDGSDGTCRISRAIELPVVEVNVNTTLGAGNHTCLVNTNAANRVITLPTAASGQYRIYRIKKIDAAANTVTVDANGAETIDGAANTVLSSQYDAVTLQSDGTTWWILSRT
jgi:hypothetical protein